MNIFAGNKKVYDDLFSNISSMNLFRFIKTDFSPHRKTGLQIRHCQPFKTRTHGR